MPTKDEKKDRLDSVTCTIVHELGKVGLFHYNKLTYLFEYLFIKNFAMRYTGELFVRIDHGPIVSNYKQQIIQLTKTDVLSTDISLLKRNRYVDDFKFRKILVFAGTNINNKLIKADMVYSFLLKVLDKYAHLSTTALEEVVYQTPPMVKYLEQVKAGIRQEKGKYVLKDCVKIRSDNPQIQGRKIALQHILKHPHIDYENQKKIAKEMEFLEKLRPTL